MDIELLLSSDEGVETNSDIELELRCVRPNSRFCLRRSMNDWNLAHPYNSHIRSRASSSSAPSPRLPPLRFSRPPSPDFSTVPGLNTDSGLRTGSQLAALSSSSFGFSPPFDEALDSGFAARTATPPFRTSSAHSGTGFDPLRSDLYPFEAASAQSLTARERRGSLSERFGQLTLPALTPNYPLSPDFYNRPSTSTPTLNMPEMTLSTLTQQTSAQRTIAGMSQLVRPNSPISLQIDDRDLEFGSICVVCEGTNGPWRRGPLGLRCLCNSCGHIPGSAREAVSYDDAIHLLEYVREQRMKRVQRRQGPETASLVVRLAKLSDRSKALAQRYVSMIESRGRARPLPPSRPASVRPVEPYPTAGSLVPTVRNRSRTTPGSMYPRSVLPGADLARPAPRTAFPGLSHPRSSSSSWQSTSAYEPLRAASTHPMPIGIPRPTILKASDVASSYASSASTSTLPRIQREELSPLRATSPASYAFGSYRNKDDFCELKTWEL